MSFDETLIVLKRLLGRQVEVTVWGPSEGALVATLVGRLSTTQPSDISLPSEIADSDVAEATVYRVGSSETTFSLWPRRFRHGAELAQASGVRIKTLDATIEVRETYHWD